MKVFDWDKFKDYESRITGVEEKLILQHYKQWLEDNGIDYEFGYSQIQLDDYIHVFRTAWILARMFTDNK